MTNQILLKISDEDCNLTSKKSPLSSVTLGWGIQIFIFVLLLQRWRIYWSQSCFVNLIDSLVYWHHYLSWFKHSAFLPSQVSSKLYCLGLLSHIHYSKVRDFNKVLSKWHDKIGYSFSLMAFYLNALQPEMI